MSLRRIDDRGFAALDVAHKFLGHPGFSRLLADAICKDDGVIRAVDALQREFGLVGVLDCDDTDPFGGNARQVILNEQIRSRVKGRWTFGLSKIKFHLDPGQQNGKTIRGHVLKKRLAGQPVLPAQALCYLLGLPAELVPDPWKQNDVCFWGSIFRMIHEVTGSHGQYVLCSHWSREDGRFYHHARSLDDDFGEGDPCAIIES